jgi:hypothetical protein
MEYSQGLNHTPKLSTPMEKDEFETLRNLLVLLLLKSGVSYEAIADSTGDSPKTLRNKFPLGKIVRREE